MRITKKSSGVLVTVIFASLLFACAGTGPGVRTPDGGAPVGGETDGSGERSAESGSDNRTTAQTADSETVVVVGFWNGRITLSGRVYRLQLTFRRSGGKLSGTAAFPGLDTGPLEMSAIRLSGSSLSFSVPAESGPAKIEAVITGDRMTGTYTEAAASGELELVREAQQIAIPPAGARPPGISRDVTLKVADGALYGTLLLPEYGENPPAVLLVPGSGAVDRNGNSVSVPGNSNSMKLLAEGLASRGIATLRYDKRGIGESAAVVAREADLTIEDYIEDALAWISALDGRYGISPVGVIGYGEGALVGMIAAREARDMGLPVEAFVSLEGIGRPAYEFLGEKLSALDEDIRDESNAVIAELRAGRVVHEVSPRLQQFFRPAVQPYLISWFRYNPTVEIKKIDIPVLIVQGGRDLQVYERDARLLARARPDANVVVIDRMNHVLKEAPQDEAGNYGTYTRPDLPLADGLLSAVSGFVERAFRQAAAAGRQADGEAQNGDSSQNGGSSQDGDSPQPDGSGNLQ